MLKTVVGFSHEPGFHCGSTSVKLMMGFYGHSLSEPFCLGMGQPLGSFYITGESFNPTRMFMTRAPELELIAFQNLGCEVRINQTADDREAFDRVIGEIDADRPAMLQVDLRYLPYYKTTTHFAGHKIIIFGYDEKESTVLVSDNEFDKPQTVGFDDLQKARTSVQQPFDLRNDWFELKVPKRLAPFEVGVRSALVGQAKLMTTQSEIFGTGALYKMADELTKWGEAKDWAWCARFAYQVIEKRGTGGGAFRKKYSRFLAEAAPYCKAISEYGLVGAMEKIAEYWTEFAVSLKAVSEKKRPDGLEKVAKLARELAELEEGFFSLVNDNVTI